MTISNKSKILTTGLISALALSVPNIASANVQQVPAADEDDDNNIVVTGTRIRQGGAQDIRHFRSVSLDGEFLPRANSLTLEGLMGEHDLSLPTQTQCQQLFCLSGYSMASALPTRPQDEYFVGLGFESNIDGEKWKRAPVSLVAVVDRSGSMGGAPITRVKEGLRAAVGQMTEGDRLGIVIYGSNTNVHLAPTDVEGNREQILQAINSIQIDGSTYMEAGLKLGYETAATEANSFAGKTRVMLFTDENANVGKTDPGSFMGMAIAASNQGIGLTTIGVGVHFNDHLALKISSVRGGNLFFLDRSDRADKLFDTEFRNMVSEVAHDINITMTPIDGYAISGVFGVPDGMMSEGQDGAITVTIPSAFLSSNGGGIYASLGKSNERAHLPSATMAKGAPILNVSLAYVSALDDRKGSDVMTVSQPAKKAPEGLVAAQLLVDQYLTMTAALDGYHKKDDRVGAYRLLHGLSGRLNTTKASGFADEQKLVSGLLDRAAVVAGYAGERSKQMKPLAVLGKWEVKSHAGLDDISRGDIVEFTRHDEMITYRQNSERNPEIYQDFKINEKQIYVTDANLKFNYVKRGQRLRLYTANDHAKINLVRVEED